jgi:soluble lytic murein transglycosylase
MRARLSRLIWVVWVVAWSTAAGATTEPRDIFVAAEKAAKAGDTVTYRSLSAQLRGYALYPYLEYADIDRQLRSVDARRVRTFLEEYADTPLAALLRRDWLDVLAGQQRWGELLGFYHPTSNTRLHCHQLNALLQLGKREQALAEVEPIWLHGESQPDACDPVFDAWRKAGRLTHTLVWQRIELAMSAGEVGLARYLERYLDPADRVWAQRWRALHDDPHRALRQADFADAHPYREHMLAHAVRRLARRDAVAALKLWQTIARRYPFDADQAYDTERQIVFRLIREPDDDVYAFVRSVAPRAEDVRLHEARLRAALYRGDWERLGEWIAQLPKDERGSDQWRYWLARSLAARGQTAQAAAVYEALAAERSFYAFLAADHIDAPYRLDHRDTPVAEAQLATVAELPGVHRARELHALGRWIEARREWRHVTRNMAAPELQAAAVIAESWGWHDQAIFTLARTGYWDDLELRFPVRHADAVAAYAKRHALDPAWVFAVVRQESAFMDDARSHAGARGLMQLMPATARTVARKAYGRKPPRPWELYDAGLNISLGTAYLRMVLNQLGDHTVLATAAYNAGPRRVRSWLPEHALDADVWIELVPFSETRGYLTRVLAYQVIYENRLGRTPSRLSERLRPISSQTTRTADTRADRQNAS